MSLEMASAGVWIVHANENGEARIVGVFHSREEAEELAVASFPFYSDLSFAHFPIGYRAGRRL